LAGVVRLAESLGAGSVKFNPVMPTARGERLHASGETLSIEELVELGRWVENTLCDATPLPLYYHHPPAFRPLSRMLGPQGSGCGACGILGILGVLWDGSYALCGIGASVPDLVFGQAARDSLAEVWRHHPVLQELREGLPHKLGGVCGACLMRGVCLGSCVAQNYYLDGDFWAPFWYCEQARQQGLFPETRLRP
jgi:SynChlorMet cassette radical SAM/SPASM protein ScmF